MAWSSVGLWVQGAHSDRSVSPEGPPGPVPPPTVLKAELIHVLEAIPDNKINAGDRCKTSCTYPDHVIQLNS